MGEKRLLTGELYGVRGYWEGGACVDHLVAGSEIEIGEDDDGSPCIFAYGRRYPANHALLYDARQRSKPIISKG